jgi:EmrB/QacA subfamily drug resistance transporter
MIVAAHVPHEGFPMQAAAPVAIDPRTRRIIVAGCMSAMFLAAVDQTIVSTALPRIISDLQGLDLLAWVFTSYMLASTTIVPLVGKLGDQFGRKPLFLLAIAIFLIGSLFAGASQSMYQLVLFRAVQGLGGGMLFSTIFAVVGDLFTPRERGRMQGLFTGVFGVASVVGPALGGWITDATSWRWVFYVNMPVGVAAFLIVLIGMPRTRPHADRKPKLDLLGAAALVATLLPFLLALVWGGDRYPWASPQIEGLLAFTVLMLIAFLLAERYAAEPILPLPLFRNRTFAVSAVVMFLVGAGMFGAISMLPLFLQGVQGVPASRAGSMTTPLTLAIVVSSILVGQWMSRTGRYKAPVLVGTGVLALGLGLFATIDVETSHVTLIGYMLIAGFGLGMTFPVFAVAVQNALPYQLLGVATASVQFFRSIGGTVGVAVFTGLMLHRFQSGIRGTAADVPAISGNLSQLLNERGTAAVRHAYEASTAPGALPWPQVEALIRNEQAAGIAFVFLVAVSAVAAAFVISWLLPEIELRSESPAEMARRATAAPVPAEQ